MAKQYTITVRGVTFEYENMAPQGSGQIEMSKVGIAAAESDEIVKADGTRWKVGVALQRWGKSRYQRNGGAWTHEPHVEMGDDVVVVHDTIWLKWEDEAGWVEWATGPQIQQINLVW